MFVCYIDEAGCTGMLPSTGAPSQIQPAFILVAVVMPLPAVRSLTIEALRLKRRFFPRLFAQQPQFLDAVLTEIKGAELRKNIAEGSHAEQRHAIGFLDKFMKLLSSHGTSIFGRVWLKGLGKPFEGTAIYTSSIQYICKTFQHLLVEREGTGVVIADSRNKPKNAKVSHSIFTQKYKLDGDPLDRIADMPTFGHSENHVGLQAADLLCSALLFPMAMHAYCAGHMNNLHIRPGYQLIHERYGAQVSSLQYRYQDAASGNWRGGMTIHDAIAQRHGGLFFKQATAKASESGVLITA